MIGFFEHFAKTDAYDRLRRRYEKRLSKERRRQIEEGNTLKKPFLYRLDRALEYSGIRRLLPFVNAEIFILFYVLALFIIFTACAVIFKNSVAGIIADVIMCVIVWGVIYVISGNYYNKLEDNIMTLLNLIENFSKTEDDIVRIFRKTIPYIGEPVRTILTEFCSEAEACGDVNRAFDNLNAKIEHRKCRELLHNIRVCSRYESNYDMLVRDCRASMMDFLAIKAERKAIINNGRAEIVILLLSAALIVYLFSNIVSGGLFGLMFGSVAGRVIVLYCAAVFMISVLIMLTYDKKGGE
ncbi:MAG: hypothetical protein HFH14_10415 [Lachnospiraceae bacterium]|nr:hypothetical protein [Lachnospiraceae bacterium]